MKEIFLVHDQTDTPWVRQNFLESAGYRVHLMASSAECLKRISEKAPDLIVADVLIEGMNGFDLCRHIRRDHSPADLPVVLCSEIYRSRLFRDEATNAGAQHYLLKPLRLDALVNAVNEISASSAEEGAAA